MRKENASDSLKTGSSHIWRLQSNSINMERNTSSSWFKPYSGQIALAEYQEAETKILEELAEQEVVVMMEAG